MKTLEQVSNATGSQRDSVKFMAQKMNFPAVAVKPQRHPARQTNGAPIQN
jgi:hypothetical protein